MPSKVPFSRELLYLRVLADTGNASLAAAEAGVSRNWAYKRCRQDARFAGLRDRVAAVAKARLPVRMNRDRADGWTADRQARFIERLRETCSVWMACAAVGLSTNSAYGRRQRRPGFAAAWDEAEREGWPPIDQPWIESARCFFEGREPSPGNPVRFTDIGQVIQAREGNLFRARRPRGLKK